jgi:hypothetical protein
MGGKCSDDGDVEGEVGINCNLIIRAGIKTRNREQGTRKF